MAAILRATLTSLYASTGAPRGPGLQRIDADAGLAAEHVASITIAGQFRPSTPFSPDQIAEKYWVVQSDGTWKSEFRFDGT
jgi:hypothetical protein